VESGQWRRLQPGPRRAVHRSARPPLDAVRVPLNADRDPERPDRAGYARASWLKKKVPRFETKMAERAAARSTTLNTGGGVARSGGRTQRR